MAKKVIKEEPQQETPVEEQQPVEEVEKKPSKRKKRKTARKAKKENRLKKRLFNPVDIKYRGPLSYRWLRVIAWLAIASGQLLILNKVSVLLTGYEAVSPFWQQFISIFSSVSTPFFIIASFGLILSGQRSYKTILLAYGMAFIGLGGAFTLFYLRYINGLFAKLGLESTSVFEFFSGFLSDKVQINVFADLFAFACLHYFLNYTPTKVFQGKKIYIFRSFVALPIIFVLGSYVLKILTTLNSLVLPFYFYPFLTTKSPIVFGVFALVSLWIKNRERLFIRLGATKAEYKQFLNTNRNSLAFSIQLSLVFLSSILLELTLFIILIIVYAGIKHYPAELFGNVFVAYQSGESLALLLAIPFILLYSYTRVHKNSSIDVIIPIIGIGLIALVYIEGVFQLIINTLGL